MCSSDLNMTRLISSMRLYNDVHDVLTVTGSIFICLEEIVHLWMFSFGFLSSCVLVPLNQTILMSCHNSMTMPAGSPWHSVLQITPTKT